MSDLGCPPNAALAFDFLVGKGLRDYQAAGIVGNLQQESGLNPRLSAPDPRPTNPEAMGRGIAMWGDPGRWQNLLAFAAGRDPWALDTQLEFLWAELPGNGLDALLASPTLEDAVIAFQDKFERPRRDLARTDIRIKYARSVLFACPSITPPIGPPNRFGVATAAVGVVALVAAVGYGVYKAMSARAPEPEPEPRPRPRPRPEPVFPPPSFRPAPVRPPWRP